MSAHAEKNHLIRLAQEALWDLEDSEILTRKEILRMTGYLQGKKEYSEND